MNVLVITGCCLKENTSANLCHRSYINGLLELNHTVDLVSFSENNINIDNGIDYPKVRNHYVFDGISLYERLASKKSLKYENIGNNNVPTNKLSLKSRLFIFAKKLFRKSYGIYNPSIVWFRNSKKLKLLEEYDLLISLSYPQVSHLLADYLIKKNRVKTKRWIQIWEDPWTLDLNNSDNKRKCFNAERKVISRCNEIIYVSPITLKRQMDLFPEKEEAMKWFPLPSYYQTDLINYNFDNNHYGYFGDYSSNVRNLRPFYDVAVRLGTKTTICGSSDRLFDSKSNVTVFPRLSLNELKIHENDTNVLVCLFNLKGGQIPGKIYQYASTNKIILVILDGTEEEQRILFNYFSKFKRFVFCKNNEEAIQKAINRIEIGDLDGISKDPLSNFCSKSIVNQIIESND